MQPKTLRAKHKGLLVSHFESHKPEEEERLLQKSPLPCTHWCLFIIPQSTTEEFFLRGSSNHKIFASAPDHSGKPESQRSAFYLWLMQPASIKQPFDKRLNMQCRNIQQYILKLKGQSQYTSSFSNTQTKVKCEIRNRSIAQYFISVALGGAKK